MDTNVCKLHTRIIVNKTKKYEREMVQVTLHTAIIVCLVMIPFLP